MSSRSAKRSPAAMRAARSLRTDAGRCRDRPGRHPARAARRRRRRPRERSPPACRSTDTAARAPPARPARRDIPPDARDCTRTGPSQSRPSQARSSSIAAANSGRQRPGSMSSIRSRNRPPASPRPPPGDQRRQGVAEMQITGRAGGEAGDDRTWRTGPGSGRRRIKGEANMPGQLDGPRWGPASKGAPRQLVVLCHGLGADGHDLIDLAPSWGHACPDALFASVARAVRARLRLRPAMVERRRPLARRWWRPACARAALIPRPFIDAELARLELPAGRLCADGVQPGRDDGAVHRPAPRRRRRAPSWPFPAR